MKEQLEKRLIELKKEYDNGQEMFADLSARHANLRESLLRISGAIQVLEEELRNHDGESAEQQGEKTSEIVGSLKEDNTKESVISS